MHAPLYAQGFFFALTHIAFQRKPGVGFFEFLPGWTRCPAKSTLVIFLAVNGVFISAGAFGNRIFAPVDRNV
jgi:hypothetical protein